jgi:hypothetical protein
VLYRRLHGPGAVAGMAALLLLALVAVGLGCGEATLGAVVYVAAWQLTSEAGGWCRRLAPLVPYAVVVLGWRLLYLSFGYGTRGSALYVDPGTNPLVFAGALAERWPLLVAAQWFQLPANAWILLPRSTQLAASAVGAALALGVAALSWRLLHRERLARFWALAGASQGQVEPGVE